MSPAPAAASLALAHHTGLILAEVAGLLLVFGGIWLVAAQIPRFRHPVARTVVAGTAFTAAGVLLIIAVRWGHFG
ncbi:hypothetical protein ACFXPX_19465 [Kitasatospora sp. NPDC059146]|uniref:hypothetical protein n=1 Tax=unclassified Kitasatospora TaxID=2633591 RepID=UPI0036C0C701